MKKVTNDNDKLQVAFPKKKKLVVKKTPKINNHAIDRFRERVIPWSNNILSRNTLRALIQNLVCNWVAISEGYQNEAYKLRTKYLRFYYNPFENEVTTILPYKIIDKDKINNWIKYYNINIGGQND